MKNAVIRSSHSGNSRTAYTLFEMLLVLAILGMISATVWPAVTRLFGDHQLLETAHLVQVTLAETRKQSVELGLRYEVHFEPRGSHYFAAPFDRRDFDANREGVIPWTFEGVLPAGLSFEPVLEDRLRTNFHGALPQQEREADARSPRVLFYPDGTTADVTIYVVDANHRYVRLSVRGLTGRVAASGVMVGHTR